MSIRYIKFSKEFTPVDLYEKYKALPETVSAKESDGYEVIFVDARDVDEFPIANLSREDFEAKGWDTSKLDNSDMEYIARKMGETFIENQYWLNIEYFAEYFGLPKKKMNNSEVSG